MLAEDRIRRKGISVELRRSRKDVGYTESHRLSGNNQSDRERQMLLKSINSHREYIPVWEHLDTDQFDPWQVVSRQVFTPYSRLLISVAFDVVSRVDCLGVTGV